jgi:hypothetical protein
MNQSTLFNSTKSCPSIFEQTGWERCHPKQICQEIEVLTQISSYSYDLSDQGFVAYFASRTGVLLTDDPRARFSLTSPWNEAEAWLLNSQEFTYLENGLPVASWDRPPFVSMYRILRGQLQDCWELYQVELMEQAA